MQFDALQITQPSGRYVFVFAADADSILRITSIPRIGRSSSDVLLGYQRPEIASHIAEIRRYLDAAESILPNTIVVAFDSTVQFTPKNDQLSHSVFGELDVPDNADMDRRTGFVVDGQQRLAAIASSRHPDFPVFVTGFIAPDVAEQRKQFVLVNRTKPLPQGMIYELLPEIDGCLPQYLIKQRRAAILTSRLNLDPTSSLYRLIKTPTCPIGVIKDNSIRRSILNSLSDGALYHLAVGKGENTPDEAMITLISTYWAGVRRAFPDAWGLPPKQSRLTHGVGIVAMGYVMDHLYAKRPKDVEWTETFVADALLTLKPHCAWTEGTWRFEAGDERHWNGLQNTDRDVRILANHFRRILEKPQQLQFPHN